MSAREKILKRYPRAEEGRDFEIDPEDPNRVTVWADSLGDLGEALEPPDPQLKPTTAPIAPEFWVKAKARHMEVKATTGTASQVAAAKAAFNFQFIGELIDRNIRAQEEQRNRA